MNQAAQEAKQTRYAHETSLLEDNLADIKGRKKKKETEKGRKEWPLHCYQALVP